MRTRLAAALILALLATSCGDDADPDATDSTTTTAAADADGPTSTSSTSTTAPPTNGAGVTDDAIQLGFLGIDFDTLRNLGLVDINRGDFPVVVDAFVDDLNDRGGINGRLVEAHVELVSPVDLQRADEVCLRLTEDVEVFAVIGSFVGPTSSANPCFPTQHDTLLVGGSPTPGERAEATAPWISTIVGTERHLPAAIRLMHQAGLFGERVGVAWDQTEQVEADDYYLPVLAELGITPVETFVQGTEGGDAIAGQSEWQVISQRIEQERIDTMVLTEVTGIFGLQQLVDNGFDGQLLVVDTIGSVGSLGTADIVPLEDLAGVIGTGFLDSPEAWDQEITQHCIGIFETANPEITVIRTDLVEEGEPNWGQNIGALCNQFRLFEAAATAAGDVLNHDTFLDGLHRIGDFELVGQGTGFLGEGRHDAGNAIRLTEFDTEDLPNGGGKPYGPMTSVDEILG